MRISALMPNLATNHIVRVAPIVKALERHHDVKLIGVLKEGEELFPPFAKEFAYTVVRWTGRGGFLATLRILPSAIDFLFLDGDHSYEGVRRDFENYAPLVRRGRIVALHDIVEDNGARYGVITGGWAGGVPRFWSELKQAHEHAEFVHDRAQDACGIGVVFVR